MTVSRRCRVRREGPRGGYNLVILVMLVAVMSILAAAALPLWSHVAQREREEELVFRGLQYAEAIRRFQQLHNRLPVHLAELLEVQPRSIRQLWTDPFRDDGKWGVIVGDSRRLPTGARQPEAGRGQRPTDEEEPVEPVQDVGKDRNRASRLSQQGVQTTGPISGVRPVTEMEAARIFMGSNQTNDWSFTVDIIPVVPTGLLVDSVPRLNSRTIGRPFPEGIEPGTAAGPVKTEEDEEREERRPRRDRRNRRGQRNSDRS